MRSTSQKLTYAVGTPHGSFQLTVPNGDVGPDGREPISAAKSAEHLLRRGFVRRSINEPRGSEPTTGPGLPFVHVAAPMPTRAERIAKLAE